MRNLFALLVLTFAAAATYAFTPGDIVVSGTYQGSAKILRLNEAGVLQQTLYSAPGTAIGGLAIETASGALYAALYSGIGRFAPDGSFQGTLTDGLGGFVVVRVAQNGEVVSGSSLGIVSRFRGSTLLRSVPAPSLHWMDLDSDQCTAVYLSGSIFQFSDQVDRANSCSGVTLPYTPIGITKYSTTMHILPDGSMLVSSYDGQLTRIARDGSVRQTYATRGTVYTIDRDPRFAWIAFAPAGGSVSRIAELDLTNDTIAAGPFDSGLDNVQGIAVAGGAQIPTFSRPMLIAIFLTLGLLAIWRTR